VVQRSKPTIGHNSCGLLSASKNSAIQAGITATEAEAAKCKNTMTSLTITAFNQLQMKPVVCMASHHPFLSCFAKKHVYVW